MENRKINKEKILKKVKYLIDKIKISFENSNGEEDFLNTKQKILEKMIQIKKEVSFLRKKAILKIASSQLELLNYSDLKKMVSIAERIIIVDNCNIYEQLIDLKKGK